MKHTCHATGCKTVCRPEFLMCRPHWARVPPRLQRQVYMTYRPGQCDDKDPSEEWHEAADAAIAAIELIEGRSAKELRPSHVRALKKLYPELLGIDTPGYPRKTRGRKDTRP